MASLKAQLLQHGFALQSAQQYSELTQINASTDEWRAFAQSWADMPVDNYMADLGRYRRRRHAVLQVRALADHRDGIQWQLQLLERQPHIQALEYNALNGGIERWFAAISDAVINSNIMQNLLQHFVSELANPAHTYKCEVHQFRIEARGDELGKPTPEGVHRDGVDWVLVLMVARVNINAGTTQLFDTNKASLGQFTLTEPLQAVFINDHQVFHGVTAVTPLDPSQAAFRDVLVVTLKRE